jgi:hypothetical protein
MVGFWRDICAKPRGLDVAGPGQPLPDSGVYGTDASKFTWQKDLPLFSASDLRSMTEQQGAASNMSAFPLSINSVWEPLESSASSLKKSNGSPKYDQCFQGF